MDKNFWHGKNVFVTGHTGFKGAWLSFILNKFGANVTGYALEPASPSLFALIELDKKINSVTGDVRDFDALKKTFDAAKPEIVFHLAAQPIVIESYRNPAATYSTNVMGAVNILECIRQSSTVRNFLNVTSDKVYRNNEWSWGYRETDLLDGIDPYSNSKSCAELVTACYRRSFFSEGVTVATARAGNVIGGGDFAAYRIIPDCVRAALENKVIEVRNPNSVRPYQHVLEPLFAYMKIVESGVSDSYNVGPNEEDCVATGDLVDIFCKSWGGGLSWKSSAVEQPREANFLKLDCSKIKAELNWKPRWNIEIAVAKIVEWTKIYQRRENISACMTQQIEKFLEEKS